MAGLPVPGAGGAGNGSLTITPVAPMPVQLVHFTTQRAVGSVALAWATAAELDNLGFGVERSADGVSWTQLAFVAGAGSSAQARAYAYTDAVAPASATYYRLRQVDKDGTSTYSAGQAVPEQDAAAPALALYPNPAAGALVRVSGADATQVLRLLDSQGRLVRELPAGTTKLDPNGLPAGLYLLRSGPATQRLIVY